MHNLRNLAHSKKSIKGTSRSCIPGLSLSNSSHSLAISLQSVRFPIQRQLQSSATANQYQLGEPPSDCTPCDVTDLLTCCCTAKMPSSSSSSSGKKSQSQWNSFSDSMNEYHRDAANGHDKNASTLMKSFYKDGNKK